MAALNRFLIGLIAVLAIAAAVLSYLLFERRTEFRDRAGTLATTVVDMTRALDAESGTNVAKKVRFSAADKAAGVPESGELSWAEYHQDKPSGYQNFARNLKLTTDLAKSINEQRNFLAESIAQLGFDLEMPVDELNADDLKRADAPEVYARAAKQVSGLAKAANARSNELIRAVVDASRVVGKPVEEAVFRERVEEFDEDGKPVKGAYQCSAEVEKFVNTVTGLNTRCTDYAKAIVDGIGQVTQFQWTADVNQVEDERDYNRALTALTNDFEEINAALVRGEQFKVQLAETKEDLKTTEEELKKAKDERNVLKAENSELAAKVKEMEIRYGAREKGGGVAAGSRRLDPALVGHALAVNEDWNFVILDLGSDKVWEGVELLVARDNAFVGRLKVTRVARNISLAELLPDSAMGSVQVNDRVIPPKEL